MAHVPLKLFRQRNSTALISICLCLITLIVYWQVFFHDFINFDDPDYVTENTHVQNGLIGREILWAFTSTDAGNWHPLAWLSHLFDVQLFGLNPHWHHLTSFLFHAANTVLLFLVLKKLTGAVWRSAFVAALFAVHPLHIESVAWIAERKDVLSAFFFLLTVLAYADFVQTKNEKLKLKKYLLALLFFAAGLMSKPMVVTTPFILLLLDYWPLNRFTIYDLRPAILRLVREKVPFFALSIISSIITFGVQQRGGAVATIESYSFSARVANALVSYARYLGKTFWPENLAVFYPHPGTWQTWQVTGAALLLLALTLLSLWQIRRRPFLAIGWFWFAGMLIPVIGLVQVGEQSLADRYSYLPLIGLFILVVWGAANFVSRRPMAKRALALGAIAVVAIYSVVSAHQLKHWQNGETLFRHAVRVTKGNYLAYHNLGSTLARTGRVEEAITNFQASLQIKPNYADTHYNLGLIAAQKGNSDEALVHYSTALRLKPDFAEAHNNFGNLLGEVGNKEDALRHYSLAVQLRPDFAEAHNNLANALSAAGRLDDAVAHYLTVIRLRPRHPQAYCNLGITLDRQGKSEEAAANFKTALNCAPEYLDARLNLGIEFNKLGKYDEAADQFRKILIRQTNHIEAHLNLANALAWQNRLDKAADHYRNVLRLQPEHPDAHHNLAQLLAKKGDWAAAVRHGGEAVRLRSDDAQFHYHFAQALARNGEARIAVGYYSNALTLSPELVEAHFDLANALLKLGREDDAVSHYQILLAHQEEHAAAHYQLGTVLVRQKKIEEALHHWREAIRLKPNWREALNNLAWLRATCPDPRFRDGTEALQLAGRAVALSPTNDFITLDTLAAAYAETGNFVRAAQIASIAATNAQHNGDWNSRTAIEKRLALYHSQQPYHDLQN